MSRLRANQITNENANGAPNFPHGLTVTGIVTATTSATTMSQIVVGSAVTANSQGIDVTGIVTATSFKGDGSNLTGIDASSIKNGSDVKVQANASGAVVTGILTTTSPGDGVGKILQVQSTLLTSVFTLSGQSSGGVDDLTGLSVNITPTRANSKILVEFHINHGSSGTTYAAIIKRGSTSIFIGDASGSKLRCTALLSLSGDQNQMKSTSFRGLDTPSYTLGDTLTYKIALTSDGGTCHINRSNSDADNATGKRTVSSILVSELAS